ncbi:hypothetical protein RBG61_11380 [Paludicola sp. MB14-C6]|uniref:hypothetical protein n=1 Tax=Paludihabitans sp. MB14-C6 TaxID=3070656 RepID=UPI0027DD98EF|nr:hypothetical protein [Paludicola sp. MB14-C6]WMJ22584.1 hypothetical protein RBG61_11380 [Paludicola sp. MB14-C6]
MNIKSKNNNQADLHGNHARIDPKKKINPVYQTLTLTSKQTSTENSKDPVTPVIEDNVILAKEYVDENHK